MIVEQPPARFQTVAEKMKFVVRYLNCKYAISLTEMMGVNLPLGSISQKNY